LIFRSRESFGSETGALVSSCETNVSVVTKK
jgi:hypothetical protein